MTEEEMEERDMKLFFEMLESEQIPEFYLEELRRQANNVFGVRLFDVPEKGEEQ